MTEARIGLDRLTDRQLEILRMVASGLTQAETAKRLGVAYGTVKAHMRAIYTRLDVRSLAQAVARYPSVLR